MTPATGDPMLTRFTPNAELARRAPGLWEALGPDPQFELVPGRAGARWAVIELAAEDRPLDAAVYLREAGQYSEAERVDFPEARALLLVVDLRRGPGRLGLRLDPAEHPGTRFRLRRWARRSRAGLRRLVAARLAARPGLTANLIGPDPGLSRAVGRLRLPSVGRPGLAQQLGRIWEMAALEASLDPLPAPEAPEISFLVPVHDAAPAWLDALLASFQAQGPGAELVLADDGSKNPETAFWLATHDRVPGLTILRSRENGGIAHATNRALAAARGRWVGLVDHDDALAPHAVDRLRRTLAANPEALFLYTDEVIADADLAPVSAFWKPAFDPILLSGVNYVNHLSLYRRDRLAAMGGLRDGFHGSQDYDLVLRYTRGLDAERILHLPYPAYIWRQRAESVSHAAGSRAVENARRVLAEQVSTLIGPARIEPALLDDLHRPRFPEAPRPKVSVVIPNRDSHALISRVVADLRERTDYPDLEIVVVDNGTTDPRVLALYEREAARGGFRYDIRPAPFNFAAMTNRGVELATGEALLLLNNDISVIDPGWLDEMVECLAYPGAGIVGARLLFPDGSLQHAGVVLGLGDLAGHWHYKARAEEPGPMGRLAVRGSMTVVTGACMLVTRACWEAVGGMDAERFAVAYNDVDLCARAREAGWGVIYTPFACLYHHESASRGSDIVGEKARRFQREKAALAARHATTARVDPCYSPWWSRFQSRPRVVVGERLPAARSFLGYVPPAGLPAQAAEVPAARPARPASGGTREAAEPIPLRRPA